MEELTLQKAFYDFLEEEGYKPELQEEEIYFHYKEATFAVEFYGNDPSFFRISLRINCEHKTAEDKVKVYTAALHTNAETKLAKICIVDRDDLIIIVADALTMVSNEAIKERPAAFKSYFDRLFASIINTIGIFNDYYSKIDKS
jgi:hypothetical protein